MGAEGATPPEGEGNPAEGESSRVIPNSLMVLQLPKKNSVDESSPLNEVSKYLDVKLYLANTFLILLQKQKK